MIKITCRQNEYLQKLVSGPKTTRELSSALGLKMSSVEKMIRILRKSGLICSSKLKGCHGIAYKHELSSTYHKHVSIGVVLVNSTNRSKIPDEEVLYAAELRRANLVGQRLITQYNKRYPNRPPGGIKNIVEKARRRKLCN